MDCRQWAGGWRFYTVNQCTIFTSCKVGTHKHSGHCNRRLSLRAKSRALRDKTDCSAVDPGWPVELALECGVLAANLLDWAAFCSAGLQAHHTHSLLSLSVATLGAQTRLDESKWAGGRKAGRVRPPMSGQDGALDDGFLKGALRVAPPFRAPNRPSSSGRLPAESWPRASRELAKSWHPLVRRPLAATGGGPRGKVRVNALPYTV